MGNVTVTEVTTTEGHEKVETHEVDFGSLFPSKESLHDNTTEKKEEKEEGEGEGEEEEKQRQAEYERRLEIRKRKKPLSERPSNEERLQEGKRHLMNAEVGGYQIMLWPDVEASEIDSRVGEVIKVLELNDVEFVCERLTKRWNELDVRAQDKPILESIKRTQSKIIYGFMPIPAFKPLRE